VKLIFEVLSVFVYDNVYLFSRWVLRKEWKPGKKYVICRINERVLIMSYKTLYNN